jgi:hypothetical protein
MLADFIPFDRGLVNFYLAPLYLGGIGERDR